MFSPDGTMIVMSTDSTTCIWDVESGNANFGRELQTLQGARGFFVFSPEGKKIVTPGEDNTALIWDVESGNVLQKLQGDTSGRANVGNYLISLGDYSPRVSSATFSPDGKKVVTASNSGSVRIWTLE
jgi:WD40 repeat protein